MIVRVSDDNDWATYYCTLCCRPFKALQEANEHGGFCGKAVPTQPVFRSYTTTATFEDTEFDGRIGDDATQLYTNETRTWQGLTDGERDAITDKVIGFNSCCGWEDDYAKAIEAALKKKNA